jgi:hypothetical protein
MSHVKNLTGNGSALLILQSPDVTDVECIFTNTSSSFALGFFISITLSTSGAQYSSKIAAFILCMIYRFKI